MELLFERALLPSGIGRDVGVSVSANGTIAAVTPAAARAGRTVVPGLAVPGIPNLHSHAFQRAMAGSAEVAASALNSFWGWRDVMYRFVARLTPRDVAAIAAFAYLEMLEAGYTAVAEFHYLHHQPDGSPYPDPKALAHAVREGARQAGIRQLLLPCLYQRAGFGADAPLPEQRRFALTTVKFLELVEQLHREDQGLSTTGVALHSLRAVPGAALRTVFEGVPPQMPIHLHIAEQRREVDECVASLGQRPIEYLFSSVEVDARWCLVHATHASETELAAIARSGAVVGLCPTTEGNLGDGRFALDAFTQAGGIFGIGSDSHVSIDAREELRAAEYAVRIWRERRGLVAGPTEPHCGTYLYAAASSGGAQALGLAGGALRAGAVADFVVIDTDRPEFAGVADAALLDAYVFAPRPGAIRDVWVGGEWLIRAGRHPRREAIEQDYRQCLARLALPSSAA